MKAAIFDPYLDTMGGGERYTLSFAQVLLSLGWQVDLEWKDSSIKEGLEVRFGMNLGSIKIVGNINRGSGYDLCFWVSDGSIPTLLARKNILHFQVPFHDIGGKSLINKMKLFRINKIVCNSVFTKNTVDKEYGVRSVVIYPPVDVEKFKPMRKENIILFVGRFSNLKQNKGQETLVKVFKKLVDTGLKDWKLILAGGVEIGDDNYSSELEEKSKGYPIEILRSPDFKTLKSLYGKAKIFWSASGFNENEESNPEKNEHFGMTIVEAMAGGVVPIVYNAGGHKEIITNGENGYLWTNEADLSRLTRQLVSGKMKFKPITQKAIASSRKYDLTRFRKEVIEIL